LRQEEHGEVSGRNAGLVSSPLFFFVFEVAFSRARFISSFQLQKEKKGVKGPSPLREFLLVFMRSLI
jgi:hypothetical protein